MSEPLTATAAAPAPSGSTPSRLPRLRGLDVARGLMLVWLIVSDSVLPPRGTQISHAKWIGLTAYDFIFPLFVLLSGCGLAMAYSRRVPGWSTAKRVVILVAAGVVFEAVVGGNYDLSMLRFTGPLQIFGLLVLFVAPLHLLLRTPRAWMVATAVLAMAHALVLLWWQQHCGGALSVECNPSRTYDQAVITASHMYRQGAGGHDPEGLMGLFGALVTASVGVTAGHLLVSARARVARGERAEYWRLLAWGVVAGVGAAVAFAVLPVAKRLWTTPFALGVAAVGVLALTLLTLALDRSRTGRTSGVLTYPLVALGRNSLLAYFGSELVQSVLVKNGGDPSWAQQIAANVAVLDSPRATYTVLAVLAWTLLTMVLHRFKVYITA